MISMVKCKRYIRLCGIAITLSICFCSDARADIVVDDPVNNSFSNVTSTYTAPDGSTVTQFNFGQGIGSYSVSTIAGTSSYNGTAAPSVLDVLTTVTTTDQVTPDLPNVANNQSYAGGYVQFHVTADTPFVLTDSYTASGSNLNPGGYTYLYDLTLGAYVNFHNNYGGNDVVHGTLVAGDEYQLLSRQTIYQQDAHDGIDSTLGIASSTYDVSLTTAVPEPSSLVLLGFGGLGLVFGAYRRLKS